MFYIVTRYIVYKEKADERSQERFSDGTDAENVVKAKKRWHAIISSDLDKSGIAYELVQIIAENGICIASEIIDNREPETEVVVCPPEE